jgi:hypothetical protein
VIRDDLVGVPMAAIVRAQHVEAAGVVHRDESATTPGAPARERALRTRATLPTCGAYLPSFFGFTYTPDAYGS